MRLTGIPRVVRLPRMVRLKQTFPGPVVQDVPAAVDAALGRLALPVRPGQTIALTGATYVPSAARWPITSGKAAACPNLPSRGKRSA